MLQPTGRTSAPHVTPFWQVDEAAGLDSSPNRPVRVETERMLVDRLRRGDAEAYEELVRRYRSRMVRAAHRLLRNHDDARDAVQDAFLCAFKAMNHFSGAAKLSTWLYRIVVNAALMKLRHKRSRPEESVADVSAFVDSACARVLPADTLLERRQARAIVRECIDRLPESYRTILMLRDVEELDTHEVADYLGIADGAVRVRVHRARQALQRLLKSRFAAA